jgi:dihydroflavonol-4-reductase
VLRDAIERPAQRAESHGAVPQHEHDLELPFAADRALPLLRAVAPQLGQIRRLSGAKARATLGWTPRDNEEIVLSTAESLMRLGLVKAR